MTYLVTVPIGYLSESGLAQYIETVKKEAAHAAKPGPNLCLACGGPVEHPGRKHCHHCVDAARLQSQKNWLACEGCQRRRKAAHTNG